MIEASDRNESDCGSPCVVSLQDAFSRFREQKLKEKQIIKRMRDEYPSSRTSEYKDALRLKFIQSAKKYLNVPYSAKYTKEDEPAAPLYLDCCGLVRRVLLDLQEEFGFIVGKWNQSYQMDTLPLVIDEPTLLRPGDLIFYEGEYFSPRCKKQKHDIVHVEIFLGGDTGETTIAARNQNGGVSVFPSYKFQSKSWKLIKYHFRSIETWLDGTCNSCCPEHPWIIIDHPFQSSPKKSIFYIDSEEESAGEDSQLDDSQEERHSGLSLNHEVLQTCDSIKASLTVKVLHNTSEKQRKLTESLQTKQHPKSSRAKTVNKGSTIDSSPSNLPNKSTMSSNAKTRNFSGNHPRTFYVCKSNGWKLVVAAMNKRGWQQIPFEYNISTRFGLKWVEKRSQIDYKAHNIGQLVNHIPNNDCICAKPNLYQTLSDYFHRQRGLKTICRTVPWLPDTYRLDSPADCTAAIVAEVEWAEEHGRDGLWIYKPPCNNRGRGIKVISGKKALEEICCGSSTSMATNLSVTRSGDRSRGSIWKGLVQRYIENPLLVGPSRLKFDIRCYLLIARTYPKTLAYYHRGYCRLSLKSFTVDVSSLEDSTIHLTNAAIQKQDDLYRDRKEQQIQLPEAIADQIEQDGNEANSTYMRRDLDRDIKTCLVDTMKACNHILAKRHGYFDLLGCDFMITSSNDLKLLEINTNPALSLDNSTLEELLPDVVDRTIEIVLKCQSEKHLESSGDAIGEQEGFELIFDETSGYEYTKRA